MQAKTELGLGFTGAGLGATPKVLRMAEVSTPWHQTDLWFSLMAAGGATLLILSIVLTVVRIRKELKSSKKK